MIFGKERYENICGTMPVLQLKGEAIKMLDKKLCILFIFCFKGLRVTNSSRKDGWPFTILIFNRPFGTT